MTATSDSGLFPKGYNESRERFLNAVKPHNRDSKLGRWQIPSKRDADLSVDYLWRPATETPDKLLVLTSGIHGAETYAGAAVQFMFLKEFLPRIQRKNMGVLIVHALNPFGFKNNQRCTENLVNLNRNFSVNGEMYQQKNHLSLELCKRFLGVKPVASMRSQLLDQIKAKDGVTYIADIALNDFIKAIGPGQFESAEFLEFGGNRLEPQSRQFIDLMTPLIAQYRDVLGLDLHTGLGHRGRLHLLTDGDGKSMNASLKSELFNSKDDQDIYEFSEADADGFYEVHGAINSVFGALASPTTRVCSITMEYGTLGHSIENQIDGLNRFLLEHQGGLFGYANSQIEADIRNWNLERSYINDDSWKNSVVGAARGLFARVLSRAGALIN
jgi:predicted deacylase